MSNPDPQRQENTTSGRSQTLNPQLQADNAQGAKIVFIT